ncbi:MAG: HIT family protein [Cyclobacteriaceae bacterium]|nr:HIT family protein [Cyclobacteriaceae bacterium]
MSSIFTKIINREIPAYIVAEDDDNIAILDINPLVVGHTLVIPKQEVDYYFDLEGENYTRLNDFLKKVARAIEAVIPCLRIGVSVIGLEVPHTHVHLIPLNSMDDINFSRAKLKLSQEEFEKTSRAIQEAYQAIS